MTARQLIWAALAVWCAGVLALARAGAFVGPEGQPPLAILAAVTVPFAIYIAAYLASPAFRDVVLTGDLRLVAALQSWRWAGIGFLFLWAYGLLPGFFAFPAAVGDMAVGFTAPWMALALARDPSFARTRRFALFNWLGILDLLVAVSLGGLGSMLLHGSATTGRLAELPLVIVPAFLVPMFLLLHVTALLQARRAAAAVGEARVVTA